MGKVGIEISKNSHSLSWIFKAAGVVGCLTILARGATIIRDAIVAAEIGPSPELDTFLLTYAIPLFLIAAFQNSLGTAWTPSFVEAKYEPDEFKKRVAYAQGVTLLVSCGVALVFVLCIPLLMQWIVSSGAENLRLLVSQCGVLFALLIPLQAIVFVWTSILQAKGFYLVTALVPICTPLAGIIGLLIFPMPDVTVLVWALVIGSMFEVVVLGVSVGMVGGGLTFPTLKHPTKLALGSAKGFGILAISSIVLGTIPLADQFVCSLTGNGGVALFIFSTRIVGSVATILNLAISQASMPVFAAAAKDAGEFNKLFRRLIVCVIIVGSAMALAIMILSEPLIKLFFGRGEFTMENVTIASAAQTAYAFVIPSYLALMLLSRAAATCGNTITALMSTGAAAVINLILNPVLSNHFGVPGVCAATSISYIVAFCFGMLIIKRQRQHLIRRISYKRERFRT